MEIYIIRHTSVAVEKGICYGQTDVSLADSYREERDSLLKHLPQDRSRMPVFSSPLTRCRRLGGDIAGSSLVTDDRIMEMNFGEWEMKPWDAIESNIFEDWARDYVSVSCPGGESFQDLFDRSVSFWKDLLERGEREAAVVTHAGVLHALFAEILGIRLKKSFMLHFDYGGVSLVKISRGRTSLNYLNRI